MTDLLPYVTAVEAKAYWTAAKNWLLIWASAGFVPRVEDNKLYFPAEWQQKFPDGPHLVEALRSEIAALVRDGNKAVLSDPRLNVAYPEYLDGKLDAEYRQLRHAEYCVRCRKAGVAELEAEKASLPPRTT